MRCSGGSAFRTRLSGRMTMGPGVRSVGRPSMTTSYGTRRIRSGTRSTLRLRTGFHTWLPTWWGRRRLRGKDSHGCVVAYDCVSYWQGEDGVCDAEAAGDPGAHRRATRIRGDGAGLPARERDYGRGGGQEWAAILPGGRERRGCRGDGAAAEEVRLSGYPLPPLFCANSSK